jgi:hypothetical protein
MTSLATTPTALMRTAARGSGERMTHRALRLRPSGDGWSLVTSDGTLLFRGLGLASRRECLARARELGALTVSA